MRRQALLAVAVAIAAVFVPNAAAANEPQNVFVVQHDGFVTVGWDPVATATDYQIERTPVDDANTPTGAAVITGVWQPARTVTPASPRFSDSGFALGGRFQWRVRARFGTANPQGFSTPVFGTTSPQWGTGPGASMRTQWESSGNATFTSDVNEYAYEAALDAASDRVRVVELGRTNPIPTGTGAPGNRPINMIVIHAPSAPATAAEISALPTVAVNCSVHGDEPQGREACLIAARELAFTDDPHLLQILQDTVVLITPTINQNGRARNTRGNETGADLNRDHAGLLQPETKAYAAMLRDYTPEVGMDLHEGDDEDLPILSARHLNVYEPLFVEGKSGLIEGWMYNHAALDGMWTGPYSSGGDSHEGILRNTFSLKNAVGMLNESRPAGGTTRPAEGTQLANRNRKSYAGLGEIMQTVEYYWQRRAIIHGAVENSIAWNTQNLGRVVTRGSYPWPNFPPVGVGNNGPDTDAVTANHIIDPPPCGYFLTETQYSTARPEGTIALRLGLHGIAQETRPTGHIVRMAQPLRGLIPTILDAADVAPEPIIAGLRLFQCPFVAPFPRIHGATANEGSSTTAPLTIGNQAVEAVGTGLTWSLTEAASDCASPGDLPWLSESATSGTTARSSSSPVTLSFSAGGIAGPATPSGLLCLSSNDAGEPVIAMPVTFTVNDITAPVTTATLTPAIRNGWYASPTLTLAGADPSGIAHTDYALDGGPWTVYSGPLSGFTTGNHFAQYRSTDKAGNLEAVRLIAFKVDAEKPSVTVTRPTAGDVFPLGKVVTAAFKCVDRESGMDTCVGTVPNGANLDTSSVGDHTFTVTATDKAGNVTTETRHYAVVYTWNGFFSPITNTETSKLNLVHAGDLVKVGFSLNGDRGASIGTFGSSPIACPSWTPHSVPEAGDGTTPGLSFGVASGHYTYGWQTEAGWAGTCRRFSLTPNDGTAAHTADFLFFA